MSAVFLSSEAVLWIHISLNEDPDPGLEVNIVLYQGYWSMLIDYGQDPETGVFIPKISNEE